MKRHRPAASGVGTRSHRTGLRKTCCESRAVASVSRACHCSEAMPSPAAMSFHLSSTRNHKCAPRRNSSLASALLPSASAPTHLWRFCASVNTHNALANSFPSSLALLRGHTHNVEGAEFSPDGQRIVTASYDKTARVWNAASGQLLAHTYNVRRAEFSPDGHRIVTASYDKTARVFRVVALPEIAELLVK